MEARADAQRKQGDVHQVLEVLEKETQSMDEAIDAMRKRLDPILLEKDGPSEVVKMHEPKIRSPLSDNIWQSVMRLRNQRKRLDDLIDMVQL